MKLSLQEGLYTTKDFREFVKDSIRWGFDAVEVWGENLDKRIEDVVTILKDENVIASSVCPGGDGIRGSLLSENKEDVDNAVNDINILIECCAKLGGAGLIIVPEFGLKKFMALYPDHADFNNRKQIFAERIGPLAAKAKDNGVELLLEPLNRYEAYFLLTLNQGSELCDMIGVDSVKVLADLFHMGIEEDNVINAIDNNCKSIGHVHLVDSNRRFPGEGDRDFQPIINSLRKGNYEGYLCMECGLAGGDADTVIPDSVGYIREIISGIE